MGRARRLQSGYRLPDPGPWRKRALAVAGGSGRVVSMTAGSDDAEPGVEEPGAEPRSDIPRLGSSTLNYIGLPRDAWRDGYHYLLTMPIPASSPWPTSSV